MTKIEELENFTSTKIEDWNLNTLNFMFSTDNSSNNENNKYIAYLNDKDVLSEIIKKCKDKDTIDTLTVLYVNIVMDNAFTYADDELVKLKNKKITTENFEKELTNNYTSSNNLSIRLISTLCLLAECPDAKINLYQDKIKTDINDFKDIICNMMDSIGLVAVTSSVVDKMLSVLFPIRSRYFDKYGVDLLDDSDKRLKTAIDNRNTIVETVNTLHKEAKKTPDDTDKTERNNKEDK